MAASCVCWVRSAVVRAPAPRTLLRAEEQPALVLRWGMVGTTAVVAHFPAKDQTVAGTWREMAAAVVAEHRLTTDLVAVVPVAGAWVVQAKMPPTKIPSGRLPN